MLPLYNTHFGIEIHDITPKSLKSKPTKAKSSRPSVKSTQLRHNCLCRQPYAVTYSKTDLVNW